MWVWGFLPGGIRPANAKLYNFYVWSLFLLLIAFPSPGFPSWFSSVLVCVWESVKISLSPAKAASLLAIHGIVFGSLRIPGLDPSCSCVCKRIWQG